MKHTALATHVPAVWEGPDSGWTTVYQADAAINALGWTWFTFAEPFSYDGLSNLMIDYSFDDGGSTSNGSVHVSAKLPGTTLYRAADGSFGTPSDWGEAEEPQPYVSSFAPNIRLVSKQQPLFSPVIADPFVEGVWTGQVVVMEEAAQIVLTAEDGNITGSSKPLEVRDLLSVAPRETFGASGFEGGPFAPDGKTYTLRNTAAEEVRWEAETSDGWVTLSSYGGVLAGDASVEVDVGLEADSLAPGIYRAEVRFANLTVGYTHTREVILNIRPVPGMIEVRDTVLPENDHDVCFGAATLSTSRMEHITVTNFSPDHDLLIAWISLFGAACFHVDTLPAFPMVLGPLQTLAFDVIFQPDSTGEHEAHVFISSNDVNAPEVIVTLSGQGLQDYLTVSPEIDFYASGYTGGPFTPESMVYMLSNKGPESLNWKAEVSDSWITLSNNGGMLLSDEHVDVIVGLNADSLTPGAYFGKVTLSNTDTLYAAPRDVALTIVPVPGIIEVTDSILPNDDHAMAFGGVIIGESRTEYISIRNLSPDYDLVISAIAIGGSSRFRTQNLPPLPWVMGPHEQLLFDVIFTPDASGPHAVPLFIASNDENASIVEVNLSGIGLGDSLAVIPDEPFYSSGAPGGPFAPAEKKYTLVNTGTGMLSWSASSHADWLKVTPSSGSLAAGASLEVVSRLNENATNLRVGNYESTVTFHNQGSDYTTSRPVYLHVGAPLCEAVNNCGLTWTSGGHLPWFSQDEESFDGISSAQSGPITHNQQSWLQTSVDTSGMILFWWRVSSEVAFDFLEFYMDGVLQQRISGDTGWTQFSTMVPAGAVLRWRYVKGGSISVGLDCGWLDLVEFIPFSCAGHCGDAVPYGLCACDAGCFERGDCCSDVCDTCPETCYTCPEDSLFGNSAVAPGPGEEVPVFYLSDTELFIEAQIPLPFENFDASGRICDVHWWGVEVDHDGMPCDTSGVNTFMITVLAASEENEAFSCVYEVSSLLRTHMTDIPIYDGNTAPVYSLPLYRYDVWELEDCCELPHDDNGYLIQISSISGDTCHFGWATTSDGEGVFLVQPPGAPSSGFLEEEGNLAFCLTGVGTEGETEGEPGELSPYFTAAPFQGKAPLTVNFTNYSTGYTGWRWDFGDGNQSTEFSPAHTFTKGGMYYVVLRIWNAQEEKSFQRVVMVYSGAAEGEPEGEGEGEDEDEGEGEGEGEGEAEGEGEGEPGWEADVAPRPEGDGSLLVNDWVQVGRFVAGLDTPESASEFQRADCAPLESFGDAQIMVNDWIQAGRYVAGLDPPEPQAGPKAP